LHRSDRYGFLGIGRVRDRQSDEDLSGLLRTKSRLSVPRVSARNDHDNSGLHRSIHFLTQWTVATAVPFGIERVAETHIHAVHRNSFTGGVQFAQVLKSEDRR